MPQLTRITRDPAVMGGKPCIRGMRVTVGTVVGLVAGPHARRDSPRVSLPGSRGHRRGPVLRRLAGRGSRSSAAPAVKLLVDMNLSPSWVERLVRHGFEAVHWSTIGAATAPDVEILTWANEHAFVLITNDLTSRQYSRPAVERRRASCKSVLRIYSPMES